MCWKVLPQPRSQMLDVDEKRLGYWHQLLLLLKCKSLLGVGRASGEAGMFCSSWKRPFVTRVSWL